MKTFRAYTNINDLDESILSFSRNLFSNIKNKIKKTFSKFKSGETVKLKLNFATAGKVLKEATEKVDLKSRMGYYSEFCTAYALSKLIKAEGMSLVGNTSDQLKNIRDNYKKNKLLDRKLNFGKDSTKVPGEIIRMEESGVALAVSIWKDMKQNIEDIEVVDFEIKITGESGKGITKADIELIARKKNSAQIVNHIEASLKAYKDWNINVSNSTFTSWIINLLAPDIGGFKTKTTVDSKVSEFIKRYGLEKQMRRIQELQSGENSPAKLKKTIGREEAKKILDDQGVYIEVRNLMIDVFENQYSSRKQEINDNFLKLLGFDGTDNVYLAVQKGAGKKVSVLSSKSSEEFNQILSSLKKKFDIEFEKSNKKVNTAVTFKADKKVLFKSNFAFRDLDKVSQFVSFKDWQ